jgi:hypothetical protein
VGDSEGRGGAGRKKMNEKKRLWRKKIPKTKTKVKVNNPSTIVHRESRGLTGGKGGDGGRMRGDI